MAAASRYIGGPKSVISRMAFIPNFLVAVGISIFAYLLMEWAYVDVYTIFS